MENSNKRRLPFIFVIALVGVIMFMGFLSYYFVCRDILHTNTQNCNLDNNFQLISGSFSDRKIDSPETALLAIEDIADILGIDNVQYELGDCREDEVLGNTYYRFTQQYKGIPVWGKSIVIVVQDSLGVMMSCNLINVTDDISLESNITNEKLMEIVAQHIMNTSEASNFLYQSYYQTQCIYPLSDGSLRLAYVVKVKNSLLDSIYLVVDANTGEVLQTVSGYAYLTNKEALDNEGVDYDLEQKNIVLRDHSRGIVAVYCSSQDSNSTPEQLGRVIVDPDSESNEYTNSLLSLSKVVDYYRNILDTNSFDNQGSDIYLVFCDKNVMADQAAGNGYKENGTNYGVLALGSCDSLFNKPIGLAVDIVGHEFTHMVMHQLLDLHGNIESMALNEAIPDIIGNLIEISTKEDHEDAWKLGEDAGYSKYDMSNYISMDEFDDLDTSGHTNAAIIAHAAYLMYHGFDGSEELETLSAEELAKLFYATLYCLPSDCTFSQFRTLLQNMALILHERGDLSIEQCFCVSMALNQVGIDPIEVEYVVSPDFSLEVLDVYGEMYDNYTLTIAGYGMDIDSAFDSNSYGQQFIESTYTETTAGLVPISVVPGDYEVSILDNSDKSIYSFLITTRPAGRNTLSIYTTFGQHKDIIDHHINAPKDSTEATDEAVITLFEDTGDDDFARSMYDFYVEEYGVMTSPLYGTYEEVTERIETTSTLTSSSFSPNNTTDTGIFFAAIDDYDKNGKADLLVLRTSEREEEGQWLLNTLDLTLDYSSGSYSHSYVLGLEGNGEYRFRVVGSYLMVTEKFLSQSGWYEGAYWSVLDENNISSISGGVQISFGDSIKIYDLSNQCELVLQFEREVQGGVFRGQPDDLVKYDFRYVTVPNGRLYSDDEIRCGFSRGYSSYTWDADRQVFYNEEEIIDFVVNTILSMTGENKVTISPIDWDNKWNALQMQDDNNAASLVINVSPGTLTEGPPIYKVQGVFRISANDHTSYDPNYSFSYNVEPVDESYMGDAPCRLASAQSNGYGHSSVIFVYDDASATLPSRSIAEYEGEILETEFTYDVNANISKKHVYSSLENVTSDTEYTRDKNGRLLEEQTYMYDRDDDSERTITTTYDYDKSGKLVKSYYSDEYASGNDSAKTTYNYDDNGILKSSYYDGTYYSVATDYEYLEDQYFDIRIESGDTVIRFVDVSGMALYEFHTGREPEMIFDDEGFLIQAGEYSFTYEKIRNAN